MPGTIAWDVLLNVIFFSIGLSLGLFQLWQAQKYYLADQHSNYTDIRNSIQLIGERLAAIEPVIVRLAKMESDIQTLAENSHSFDDRLFKIVERQYESHNGPVASQPETAASMVGLKTKIYPYYQPLANLELPAIVEESNLKNQNISEEKSQLPYGTQKPRIPDELYFS